MSITLAPVWHNSVLVACHRSSKPVCRISKNPNTKTQINKDAVNHKEVVITVSHGQRRAKEARTTDQSLATKSKRKEKLRHP